MMKKIIFRACAILLPFFFIVTLGEILFQSYHYIKPFPTQDGIIIFDDRLGWKAAPNYISHKETSDAGGVRYTVDIQTNQYGFRMFGQTSTSQKKIFFLGDSFTQAQHVSNDKTYYSILEQQGIGEIFAYGTSGYGTLQEWLIAEQYLGIINPDVIVIQFCSNDFINNSYALELQSSWNNSGKRRPYFNTRGDLFYAIPKTQFIRTRDLLMHYSLFANAVIWRLDRLYAATHQKTTIDVVIQQMNGNVPEFYEAICITDRIFKTFRTQVPAKIPIYVFEVDNVAPYHDTLKQLVQKNNMIFLDGIPDVLQSARQQGIITFANDLNHWNETGHAIVAKKLREDLSEEH